MWTHGGSPCLAFKRTCSWPALHLSSPDVEGTEPKQVAMVSWPHDSALYDQKRHAKDATKYNLYLGWELKAPPSGLHLRFSGLGLTPDHNPELHSSRPPIIVSPSDTGLLPWFPSQQLRNKVTLHLRTNQPQTPAFWRDELAHVIARTSLVWHATVSDLEHPLPTPAFNLRVDA